MHGDLPECPTPVPSVPGHCTTDAGQEHSCQNKASISWELVFGQGAQLLFLNEALHGAWPEDRQGLICKGLRFVFPMSHIRGALERLRHDGKWAPEGTPPPASKSLIGFHGGNRSVFPSLCVCVYLPCLVCAQAVGVWARTLATAHSQA